MAELLMNFKFVNEAWCLVTPLIIMALDIVTGTVYSWSSKTFKSSIMRTGLSKKVGEIAVLVLGEVLALALDLPSYIMVGVSAYIILMEVMSIFENLDKLNVPIPKFVKNIVNNVNDSLQNDDYATLKKKYEELEKKLGE